MGPAFVEHLLVGKFHGIGPVTAAKMQGFGIETGKDLGEKPLEFLLTHFGEVGHYYYNIARGIDHREVKPNRVRKSVGAENTFSEDLSDYGEMCEALKPLIAKVWSHCQTSALSGRTLTLKVKYADFTIITRRSTSMTPFKDVEALTSFAFSLLAGLMPSGQPVRLLGVSLSNFRPETTENEPAQMALML